MKFIIRFLNEIMPDYANDREVIIKAINLDGTYISYASDSLKADKEMVMLAVKNNGNAFNDINILNSVKNINYLTSAHN